jgi:hypothetical protein
VQNRKFELALIFGIVAANAHASNSAEVQFSGHRITWLRISAFTDVPLAQADVAVYDTAGRLLFEKRHATNSQGVFPARMRTLPPDFRVTVAWDGHSENDLRRRLLGGFTLNADVENFDAVHGIVYVNPVTTIVSRVLDRSRGKLTLQRAQALVRHFFVLPPNASLGAALREGTYFRSRYFSQKVFLAEAAKYWGVEPFLQVLVSQILTQPEATHAFATAPDSSVGGVFSFVAENLAKGALSWAAGQGCGWAAQSAGLTTPGATAEDIANLQQGLAGLQSSIDELSEQLQDLVQQLSAKIDAEYYHTTVTPALALAAQVDGVESDLTYFAQGCPPLTDSSSAAIDPVPPDFCTSQKATVVGELNDVTILHSYETLSTYVLDNKISLSNGIIHQFSLVLGETVRFFRPADSTKMQDTFDYWDSVLTQAANLKVELLHVNGAQDNQGGIAQLTSFLGDVNANPPTQGTFQNTHNSELQAMLPPVPVGTVVDTKTRFMWRTDYQTDWTLWPSYPDCQTMYPGSIGNRPLTDNTIWNGLVGWSSPYYADLQTLVDGGPSDPMTWLIDQTKAVAPDSPLSAGVSNIVSASGSDPKFHFCTVMPWVWSVDKAPPIPGDLIDTAYYVFNFKDGTKTSAPAGTGPGINPGWLWQFMRRGLERDEQYYWYQ